MFFFGTLDDDLPGEQLILNSHGETAHRETAHRIPHHDSKTST